MSGFSFLFFVAAKEGGPIKWIAAIFFAALVLFIIKCRGTVAAVDGTIGWKNRILVPAGSGIGTAGNCDLTGVSAVGQRNNVFVFLKLFW